MNQRLLLLIIMCAPILISVLGFVSPDTCRLMDGEPPIGGNSSPKDIADTKSEQNIPSTNLTNKVSGGMRGHCSLKISLKNDV